MNYNLTIHWKIIVVLFAIILGHNTHRFNVEIKSIKLYPNSGKSVFYNISETAPEEYKYDVVILYDKYYQTFPNWNSRIHKAIKKLNKAFSKLDIRFNINSIVHFEISDSIYIHTQTFEILSEQRKGSDIAIMFSGKYYSYITGIAIEESATMIICSSIEERERKALIHEMGHLFGLSHVEKKRNYMQASIEYWKVKRFIPENEEIIKIMRERNFKEKKLSQDLIEKRLPLLLKIYETYKTDYTILNQIGDAYYETGNYSEALSYHLKALDYVNNLIDEKKEPLVDLFQQRYRNISKVYSKQKNYKKAIEYISLALSLDSSNSSLWQEKGFLMIQTNDYKAAINILLHAVKLDSADAISWFHIGYCNSKLEHYQEAIRAFNRTIHIEPNNKDAWHNLGICYIKKGEKDKALKALEKAIILDPDNYENYLMIGTIYVEQGDIIISELKHLEFNYDYKTSVFNEKHKILKKDLKTIYEKALVYLEKCISLNEKQCVVWNHFGKIYTHLDMPQKAKAAYAKEDSCK